MSILNFFKKSPKGPSVKVRILVNQNAKEKACIRLAQSDNNCIFIAWSKVTYLRFQEVFKRQNIPHDVILARDIIPNRVSGKNFTFIERHYNQIKESKLLESLEANDVIALVSLSDPIMSVFDSSRIIKLLESMGHNEDDHIEHKMINKSIEKAMEKIKSGDFSKENSKELVEWIEGIA